MCEGGARVGGCHLLSCCYITVPEQLWAAALRVPSAWARVRVAGHAIAVAGHGLTSRREHGALVRIQHFALCWHRDGHTIAP